MFNFRKLAGLAGAAILALGLVTTAEAVPFGGNFSGTISNPTGATTSPFVRSRHSSNSVLRWGTVTNNSWDNSTNATQSSSLSINSNSFAGEFPVPTASGAILLGTISWLNRSNFKTGGSWNTNLSLAVSYNAPSASGPHSSVVGIRVNNTEDPDTNPGGNHGTGNVPDTISGLLISGASFGGTPLDLGSGLSVIGYLVKLESAGTAGTSGFSSSYTGGLWTNREGNTSVLGIYAQVQVIPLPAAVWLMIAGIGGLGLATRRRRLDTA